MDKGRESDICMIRRYNPIGTTFREGDVILTPKEIPYGGTECDGCWYNARHKEGSEVIYNYQKACCVHGHLCTPLHRRDKKQVIFIEVKQNNEKFRGNQIGY